MDGYGGTGEGCTGLPARPGAWMAPPRAAENDRRSDGAP